LNKIKQILKNTGLLSRSARELLERKIVPFGHPELK